jgi:uncharacterized protein (DUF4415 family)
MSDRQRKELNALARLPDDRIDLSDIPELTEEQIRSGTRGRFYRPIKKLVSIRLDADVIEWLKQDDQPYQTKANALLRREMMRATLGKAPASADEPVSIRSKSKKSGTR